ncbi:hypothetical protein M433DRAFT_42283, partial [Acidomyces richmondensis BFW]
DVLERTPAASTAPTAPTLKSRSGFPEHTRRGGAGRFRPRRSSPEAGSGVCRADVSSSSDVGRAADKGGDARAKTWEEEEKRRVDGENRQRLANMTDDQIQAERQELLSSLSPAFIQRVLKRSNIDSGGAQTDLALDPPAPAPASAPATDAPKPNRAKSVSFATPQKDGAAPKGGENGGDEAAGAGVLAHGSIHFPRPPQPPDLDPSSETFLEDLHDKYFPSLPAEPEKLEWMQSSKSIRDAYSPSACALHAKDIRFSFTGELIPPRTAAQIPVTAGLHHHGESPDAAGYTIAELAHLARSSYPAQRCLAFQTLGRVLFRLGRGEFGDSGELAAEATGASDSLGELARGLWHEVERNNVIETLVLESEGQGPDRGRHVSAKAYATEAVWLWRKGGGRRWK